MSAKPSPVAPDFFNHPVVQVAKALLGKGLAIQQGKTELLAELIETEAYIGSDDPAAHTYRGQTLRNRSMFLGGGVCYVYRSYGMHWCLNVVTGAEGSGHAVLLRAARPITGLSLMRRRRKLSAEAPERALLSGPAKLTQAFGIDKTLDGTKFNQGPLRIVDLGIAYAPGEIVAGPRIGISKAKDRPLRFVVAPLRQWLSKTGF